MIPGGGREEDEDEHTCVAREVLEPRTVQRRVAAAGAGFRSGWLAPLACRIITEPRIRTQFR
jgi:hypothetical protein